MELLVLKSGSDYLRLKGQEYELVGMNKASVYPLAQSEFVIGEFKRLKQEISSIEIKQLNLSEQAYPVDE